MSSKIISVRIDEGLKNKAQDLANEYGITLNSLINIKLKEFVREKKIIIGENDDNYEYYQNDNYVNFEGTPAKDVILYIQKSLNG